MGKRYRCCGCCHDPIAGCKSFDYTSTDASATGGLPPHCNLADVDASRNMGETVASRNWDLYEKPEAAIADAARPPLGAAGCASLLSDISGDVNDICCGGHGEQCSHGAPRTCSEECAAVWMPFAKQCSQWLGDQNQPNLMSVTTNCERQQFGKYKPVTQHTATSDCLEQLTTLSKVFTWSIRVGEYAGTGPLTVQR